MSAGGDGRQRRRAQEARAKLRSNALNVEAKDELKALREGMAPLRQALFGILRSQGRVRVPKADYEALGEHDRIDFKVDPMTGDLMMTYVPGESPKG